MDRWLIRRIDFEIKCLNLLFTAKARIKLHQLSADAQLPIPGMNTNIEKFRFVSNISETHKADNPTCRSFFHFHNETVGERAFHLLKKHILGPRTWEQGRE